MASTGQGRERRLLLAAFLLALGFTGFYAVRTAPDAVYRHVHRDEQIAGWMTLGYVARSYHVFPQVLFLALGMDPGPPERRNIATIAAAQGRSVDQVAAVLANAIVHAWPPYPPPGSPPSRARAREAQRR
jgi:hypothetical protein